MLVFPAQPPRGPSRANRTRCPSGSSDRSRPLREAYASLVFVCAGKDMASFGVPPLPLGNSASSQPINQSVVLWPVHLQLDSGIARLPAPRPDSGNRASHPRFEHLQTGVSVLYVHHGDQSAVAIYSVWIQLNLPAKKEAAHCLLGPVAERLVHFRAIYKCKPDLDKLLAGCQNFDRVAVCDSDAAPLNHRLLPGRERGSPATERMNFRSAVPKTAGSTNSPTTAINSLNFLSSPP
jgi:hypothetical protein